ncbi:hypothetical protein tb265_08940 [Gemmatimonadetes bacterium T265]|nr:hypothetical protein tb265_08940 [Gemmatimonadetes bacterium T265]
MAGKTLSAHVSEAVVRRVEQIARYEARPVSQVVAAALEFYARLPGETYQSLRTLAALGGDQALDDVARAVARAIVGAEWELATHRLASAIPEAVVAGLDTEEDILGAAVRLTSSPGPEPVVVEPAAESPPPRRRSRRTRAA